MLINWFDKSARVLQFGSWVSILACVLLAGCSDHDNDGEVSASISVISRPDPTLVSVNNRAVGLMGRYDYVGAEQAFAQVLAAAPGRIQARVNLAIATLNRQQDGDEQAALRMVDAVIADHPENLRAQYIAGLLRLYLSSPEQALPHFRQVAEADPRDAYAAYYLAQCLFQLGQAEAALPWYQRAIEHDPYLRSAYYGAFQTLRRLGDRGRARAMMSEYQRLANNPRARLAEFKYTRMGAKAEVQTFDSSPGTPRSGSSSLAPGSGESFAPRRSLAVAAGGGLAPGRRVAISRTDTGVGDQSLLFINGSGSEAAPNQVFELDEQGMPVALPAHPLSHVTRVNAALWGDYDNDGLTDVYLLRDGGNQLWRQQPAGQWQDVTSGTKTAAGERDTVDGLMVDADHDGDLDLFLVNADGGNELLNNDLDGGFRPIAVAQGIAGDQASRQAIAADLDGDRDLDLVVINDQPPHQVWRNDRLWAYQPAPGFEAFIQADIVAAVVGDWDADGRVEVYSADSAGGLWRWTADQDGQWQAHSLGVEKPLIGPRPQLALADIDGDGVLDLFAGSGNGSGNGWSALKLGESKVTEFATGVGAMAAWRGLLLRPERGPEVLAVDEQGGLQLWPAGPGRHPFLVLSLSGMADPGQAMRSNASGIGARVAVRRGSHWSLLSTRAAASAPGQDLAPLAVGLAGAGVADFVGIDWSDGVYQTELALGAGERHRLVETQRQLSSCPVLFAWDGERYRFVSDLLGVGGIGYALGRGDYSTPRPWENFLFPAGLLQPVDGRYRLKIGEPMEEVAYLDAARLVAWDLPPGWGIVLDERMGINDPQPTGEPLFYRQEVLPVRALNDRGEDMLAAISAVDARAAEVGPLDRRFIGRLAAEHQLTLEFAQALDSAPGQPVLMIDGWVEYPYSQTQFAAWQAGAVFQAPSLDARDEQGRWQPLLPEFGYPAGMPRRMSVPLTRLPKGTRALRLRTNLEVYWDRIAVVYAETPPLSTRTDLRLSDARLARVGFPLRSTGPQRHPDYDWQRRTPFWDVNYQAGWYTRPGPVEELVGATDDAVALIGPGDEVQLEFLAPVTALPEGWTRFLVLETNGWAKDRDLFTRDGETVGPLPSTGRPRQEVDRLHAEYNTRYQDGR